MTNKLSLSNIDKFHQIKMKSELFFEYNGSTNDSSIELSKYLISRKNPNAKNWNGHVDVVAHQNYDIHEIEAFPTPTNGQERKKCFIQYKKIIIIDKLADGTSFHHWIVSDYIVWMSMLNLIWPNIILFSNKIALLLLFICSSFHFSILHFRTQKSQSFKFSICSIEIHFH